MRITADQRAANEDRIRAATDRLLRGDIPPGGRCDIKTLARESGVDRTAFYGTRPYAHLRAEFEQRLQAIQQNGEQPDPRDAHITWLRNEIDSLRGRLAQSASTIGELTGFRAQALARLAAQHDEITRLRHLARQPPSGGFRPPRPVQERKSLMTSTDDAAANVVARYFEMWNTGNSSTALEILSPDWADHAHPEVNGPEGVRQAVGKIRAAQPGLQFHIEGILSGGDLIAAIGRVATSLDDSRPGTRLIWLIRMDQDRMAEMWTYRDTTPPPATAPPAP